MLSHHPTAVPNTVTKPKTGNRDEFYISYNNRDIADYGCDTTALVYGQMLEFYILNGDHQAAYKPLIEKGWEVCLEYFKQNAGQMNKLSDIPGVHDVARELMDEFCEEAKMQVLLSGLDLSKLTDSSLQPLKLFFKEMKPDILARVSSKLEGPDAEMKAAILKVFNSKLRTSLEYGNADFKIGAGLFLRGLEFRDSILVWASENGLEISKTMKDDLGLEVSSSPRI